MSESAPDRRYLGLDGFRELVRSVKDPAAIDTSKILVVSGVPVEVKAIGGDDSRMIEFIISTDRVDRDQDVVAADGWDFDDYEKNPVVLWCHDHYAPVIGNARSLKKVGNTVKSITEFTPQDLNPFGYMIYRLYAANFMHAVSVGFQPIEYTMSAERKFGMNYAKQSLLEYSAVPVPANPDALAVARSKGIDVRPMYDWASRTLDEKAGMSDEARRRTEILRSVSAPSGRALILEIGEMKMAGNDPKDKPPSSSSAIKMVERWDCGEKGHSHETQGEAEACHSFDVAVTDATKSLQQLQTLVKSGRTIKSEAAALLRSTMDDLVPKSADEDDEDESEDEAADDKDGKKKPPPKEGDKKGDESEDESDDDEKSAAVLVTEDEKSFSLDEEALTGAIRMAVDEQFNKVTGRVD